MVEADKVKKVPIDEEMKGAYLDYAMSVIVGRALPRVEDGLKPVHRRILYALKDLGITSNGAHKKSARIVGEVLGKYHPHGESSVYDSMVRMAQEFSYRYPLVDGHGNFGSVDGDSAAAMRYTESKMSPISEEMLRDINKDTVDFTSNFDDTLEEPEVLPARIPNLLVNGSAGIAVGMSTSIPPHNLGDVIDGIIRLIDNPNLTIEELMESIPGPDFPTGGSIMNQNEILKAYRSGRGRLRVRAKTRIEKSDDSPPRIIVEELPYQVNKARLIEKIAQQVRDEEITQIKDLRDESDRRGLRIVIELKKGTNPDVLLNLLYKNSRLQTTFSVIMLALVEGEPELLSLKEMLYHYLEHQKEVVRRRTEYDLEKAEKRAHIVEGYLRALDAIDEIVELIKQAPDSDTASDKLQREYDFSEKQADAILSMRLKRLTALEREKLENEFEKLQVEISELRGILESEEKLMNTIKEEMLEIKEKYDDERRTEILNQDTDLDMEDLIAEKEMVISLTERDYIKRTPVETYRPQHRAGKGIIGMDIREDDEIKEMITATTHDTFLFFTDKGSMYRLKGYQIPKAGRTARGNAIINLLSLDRDESIDAVITMDEYEEGYLVMATRNGQIKRSKLENYNSNYSGLKAIRLAEDDRLVDVLKTKGNEDILLITSEGNCIKFSEEDLRPIGRNTFGVKGIELEGDDHVAAMARSGRGDHLMVLSDRGYGKKTSLKDYRLQQRGGKGVITARLSNIEEKIAGAEVVDQNLDQDLFIMTRAGKIIRVKIEEISEFGRNTQGVKIITPEESDIVAALSVFDPETD
ncbi:DNA gyrase subunit A [Halarsenatibacter silvermanii]|uniref:DNA gyrase subunit A n=1 Tax=Halarsenatibacter silvermanii TaxID=321763 RepID=A0A1G9Q6W4_9FIRM|nr:DNA gyrase subunit A [Halarsenatibacter silvermanii]SDM06683.1 DNA gyrase subunit A [Halarsenatibacter silvermanii]